MLLSQMDMKPIYERIIKEMEEHPDKAWGFYIYDADGFAMGKTIVGTYDGISIRPDEQEKIDGYPVSNQITFLHSYPIKDFKEQRSHTSFSGTDIGSEFAKAVHDDKRCVNVIAYKTMKGQRCLKTLILAGKSVLEPMQRSNPDVSLDDILSITDEGLNTEKVDWQKFQDDEYIQDATEVLNIDEELAKLEVK